MNPDDIIKFVFQHENVDLELRYYKSKKHELVQARYRSMYLIHHFCPKLNDKTLAAMFKQDRCTVIHAYKVVNNGIVTDKRYSKEIADYINRIIKKNEIRKKLKVNCTSATLKMTNKRAILKKTSLGYVITLKRLNGKSIEEATLNISDEAMEGINEAYQLLK